MNEPSSALIDECRMIFPEMAPHPGLSSRWTLHLCGFLKPRSNNMLYEFSLLVDGRAKLWIDNQLVVNNWEDQKSATLGTDMRRMVESSGVVKLEKGRKYKVVVEYTNVRAAINASEGEMALNGSVLRIGGAEVIDPDEEIGRCVKLVGDADVAVVVVGLNGEVERSGWDRSTLRLPGRTDELVQRCVEVCKKVVVVNQSVSRSFLLWC